MGTVVTEFVLWSQEDLDQALRRLERMAVDPTRPCVLELREHTEPPSAGQRGYYYTAVLPALCAWSGYRKHEMDAFLRDEFGPKADMEVGGRRRVVSTFSMGERGSKRVASTFLDMVLQWAAEQGVFIPSPKKGDGNRTAREV